MPSHVAINPAIQQMYVNGHFCYAYKFSIVTNGLGIVRNTNFYNKDFLKSHSKIIVEKISDSPDEDKRLADAKALFPTLKDFFQKHPLINPKHFSVMLLLMPSKFINTFYKKHLSRRHPTELVFSSSHSNFKLVSQLPNSIKLEFLTLNGIATLKCTHYSAIISTSLSLHYVLIHVVGVFCWVTLSLKLRNID